MRGTPISSGRYLASTRITPAHAGNTNSYFRTSGGNKDHPRTCGEHETPQKQISLTAGSPPHMRGTPISAIIPCSVSRITPAHAGNTGVAIADFRVSWDHPRTCGEHYSRACHRQRSLGSPPHMRGTLISAYPPAYGLRITPAHAGNTFHED